MKKKPFWRQKTFWMAVLTAGSAVAEKAALTHPEYAVVFEAAKWVFGAATAACMRQGIEATKEP